jgi:hypothetical protein
MALGDFKRTSREVWFFTNNNLQVITALQLDTAITVRKKLKINPRIEREITA